MSEAIEARLKRLDEITNCPFHSMTDDLEIRATLPGLVSALREAVKALEEFARIGATQIERDNAKDALATIETLVTCSEPSLGLSEHHDT